MKEVGLARVYRVQAKMQKRKIMMKMKSNQSNYNTFPSALPNRQASSSASC
jgi:hypothetical protein